MCAQFIVKANLKNFAMKMGWRVDPSWEEVDLRILPHQPGLVFVKPEAKKDPVTAEGRVMSFSLIPYWSKTPRVKFATHNARLETVAQKPTWKKPFYRQHCLVPVSRFIEPIYEGDYAGHMVQFYPQDEHLLMAAGLYDQWVDKKNGEVKESFAIITDQPNAFVAKTGHDRMPIFLPQNQWESWLDSDLKHEGELKEILQHREEVNWNVNKDRPMKPGWEKRK